MRVFERNISRLRLVLFSFEFMMLLGILYTIDYVQFLLQNGFDAYWAFNTMDCLEKCLVFVDGLFIVAGLMVLNGPRENLGGIRGFLLGCGRQDTDCQSGKQQQNQGRRLQVAHSKKMVAYG